MPKPKRRLAVYLKFNGHCAYCGKELKFEEMQIDHVFPKSKRESAITHGIDVDHIDNLFPSCATCNQTKGDLSVAKFRKKLKEHHQQIQNSQFYKTLFPTASVKKSVVFHFEKFSGGLA